jgi:hypothetical protein
MGGQKEKEAEKSIQNICIKGKYEYNYAHVNAG